MELVVQELFNNQDLKYRDFIIKLIPNIDPKTIIGIRSKTMRDIGKNIFKNNLYQEFLDSLPHQYYEENILHIYILSILNLDFNETIILLDKFVPYMDNWAVTDSYSNKVFTQNKDKGLKYIKKLIASKQPYSIRFGIILLMKYYLDDFFDSSIFENINQIKSDNYYVKMAIAWFYASALIKQYDETIKIIESKILDPWIQNKTISKANDSFQINKDIKEFLKKLKIK